MKQLIMYMYNLKNINIYKIKNKIYIKDQLKKYYFHKIYNEKRLYEIYNLLQNKTEHYKIIKNINNELFTIYNNNKYVLLEVNNNYQLLSKNIKYNAIDHQNLSINHSNWEYLWTIKNDYYDRLNTDNKYIQETKDYYMGLAENALQFVKYNNIKTTELVLCRLEIIDEKIPTNIILDCKEREIAEIIKKEFFYKNKTIEEIIIELDKVINKYDIKKIIARLLYPNYYFDLYDQFINKKENIKEITNIISKNKKYEELIKKIYHKYPNDLLMIDWLIKD